MHEINIDLILVPVLISVLHIPNRNVIIGKSKRYKTEDIEAWVKSLKASV